MMADRLGQQLGNYRLIQLLGQGGFAEVYLGRHIHLDTSAAIKVLHTSLISDDIERFRNEARTIAHLEHPNIVRVLEFGVEKSPTFLVMSYAPHGTLRRRHPKGVPLALATVLSYVKQVAGALQYAHNHRLIHRDVKPENMLLGSHNEVLLSDFGFVLIARSSLSQATNEMAGTIPYMAPEQLQGRPRPATDQYGLGVVIYEWLTGDRPFQGSALEIATQHMLAPPPPLRERNPAIAPDVEEVVMIALAKEPERRFASVRAFATALEQACPSEVLDLANSTTPLDFPAIPSSQRAVFPPVEFAEPSVSTVATPHVEETLPDSLPSTPMPISSVFPTSNFSARLSRRGIIIGLAGLVVVGGGFTWWELARRSSPPPSSKASLYIYHGHHGSVGAVAWSPPVGRRIASGGGDKTVQVWDAVSGGNALIYRGHAALVYAVAWSPDSKRIASTSDDQTVQVWDAITGDHVFTYQNHSGLVTTAAWSPDGTRIASGGQDKTIQIWDTSSGNELVVCRGHAGQVNAVAWSDDGTHIVSASADRTARVWDASSGNTIFIYRGHSDIVWDVAWSPVGKRIASSSMDGTVQVWQAPST